MTPGFFITGTDTGVGKTRVATALAHLCATRGLDVRVRKPVESGCLEGADGPVPQDAAMLWQAVGAREPIERVCRCPLRAALSSERAAAIEGVELGLEALHRASTDGVGPDSVLLVEGAGGFYSPIAHAALNADLAAALGLRVVVVAADRLGTISHTLLTVEAVRGRGLAVAGVVLSQPLASVDAAMDNAGELERWLGAPVLRLPHGGDPGPAAWRREAACLAPLLDAGTAAHLPT